MRIPFFVASLSALLFLQPLLVRAETPEEKAKLEFFESRVRPILVEHCYSCHSTSSGESNGELLLDTAAALRRGGTRGPTIPDNLDTSSSLLMKAILYKDPDLQMPPTAKLSDAEIESITQWIQQGAVDPRVDKPDATATPKESIESKAKKHWSYQPLNESLAPSAQISIDALLRRQFESVHLQPNGLAPPRTLIHRLYYDLHGLPPTIEQVTAFEQDGSPNAYEALVDSLLASPHFGERFARHWMDVARYADTKGYVFTEDREYTHAWRYRQWLIDAFNRDLPFDQFASLQIAADRIDPNAENKNLDAMGFLTLGRRFLNDENDIADDRIDVVTRGFLGLSVACARCHDHKFDPIQQADYYSLHSAMVSSMEPKDEPSPLRMVDKEQIRPAVVYKRGNPGLGGPTVDKKFVMFLSPVTRPLTTGSGRLEIAQSIVDARNPLTSRVVANRVWGWLMGAHLVDTPSDFGIQSPKPIQSELLDHLALSLVREGWSVKRLIKRIVMSDAYRRDATIVPSSAAIDTENRYFWRANRKRIDFESLRDSVLAATGLLDRAIGGPSVKMIEPPFSNRRTLYAHIDRQNLEGVFRSFDFASPDTHVPVRLTTTVPQQGLFMMNSPMIQSYADEFAKRIVQINNQSQSNGMAWVTCNQDSVRLLFQKILQRQPSDHEIHQSIALLTLQSSSAQSAEQADGNVAFTESAWADLIQALLCTNEFAFVD